MRSVAVCLTLLAVSCGYPDSGWITLGDYDVEPAVLPVVLVPDGDVTAEELAAEAEWWHEQTCPGLFEVEDDEDLYLELDLLYMTDRPIGYALIYEAEPPTDEAIPGWTSAGPLGMAVLHIEYGQIDSAEVMISSRAEGDWRRQTIRHELGHLLGLADDPDSVDADSVMSDRAGSRVTPADRERACSLVGW
jgi:hypothetical protein